ncbi:hypothetical protein [Enterobacter ludwigii]|uniref:hypothetical protein n=1 Tax=Enterobacter ludwigii TaxID=299767 RepID=UPI003D6DAB9D
MKPTYEELEQRLIESERYGRQTDITIDNLDMKVAQMAAENAGLKSVPCDVADPLSHSVAKGFFDDNDGRWLRNNSATWKELLKHAIAVPKHTPAPEYRGAPRKAKD